MQWVVGDIAIGDQLPDLLFCPVGQWVHLDQLKPLIPANDRSLRPIRTLIAADGTGPGVDTLRRLLQQFDLAVLAAATRVQRFVLLDRVLGPFELDFNPIPLAHTLT